MVGAPEPVRVERDGARVLVTIDRPHRRNALDLTTLQRLAAELDSLAATIGVDADDPVRVVVLTGAPPAFCAGADLTGVEGEVFAAALTRVLTGLVTLPVPVIAAVDGPALGAGTQLAIACDLRVATPTSHFGIPAARLGLMVDQWTVRRLHEQFTTSVATAMLVAAETYDAARLAAAGAVHRIGDLAAALTWADELAALAPLTMAGHKLAGTRLGSAGVPGAAALDPGVETARQAAWASADAHEGPRAFSEKRRARFTGR